MLHSRGQIAILNSRSAIIIDMKLKTVAKLIKFTQKAIKHTINALRKHRNEGLLGII